MPNSQQLSTHYNSLTGFAQTVMLTDTFRFTAVKMLILFQKKFEGIVRLRAILLLFSLNEFHLLQRSGDKAQKKVQEKSQINSGQSIKTAHAAYFIIALL